MIDTTFTLTESEYCEAMGLFRPLRPGMSHGLRIVVLVAVCLSFGYLLHDHSFRPRFAAFLLAVVAFPLIIDAFLPAIRRRKTRRGFRALHNALTGVHVHLDAAGYTADGPLLKPSEFPWSSFTGWQEGETVFILRRGKSVNMLPRSTLSPPQLAELRALLETHIGAPTRSPHTSPTTR